MEKNIKSFTELKEGDLVLIKNHLVGDDVAVVVSVYKSHKYPITSNGVRQRSLGLVNGNLAFISAKDEGCVGDEMILHYDLLGSFANGSYSFNEMDNPSEWSVRLIDESHPKFDRKLSNDGKSFSEMMGMFSKMFKD
jgi:hypothetical protein